MLTPIYTKRFKQDLKRITKSNKAIHKLKSVMQQLMDGKPLTRRYHDHSLKGNYADCRECHLEPDWLLIYFIQEKAITFVRTGSHSELFKK